VLVNEEADRTLAFQFNMEVHVWFMLTNDYNNTDVHKGQHSRMHVM